MIVKGQIGCKSIFLSGIKRATFTSGVGDRSAEDVAHAPLDDTMKFDMICKNGDGEVVERG